jgi:hypothetical protein
MAKQKLQLSLLTLLFGVAMTQQLKAVGVTNVNFGTISGPYTSVGMLPNQGQVLEATFSITAASNLTIYTDSYGGGTNADGTSATYGGFMPSLVLYNSSGNYVAGETFPSPIANPDPHTPVNGDAYLSSTNLAAGTYILTLSDFLVQQSPTATNLSDGFVNYGSGNTFTDAQGNLRNGSYSLNLSATAVTPSVPEPATFWLMVPAVGGLAVLIRKRKAA